MESEGTFSWLDGPDTLGDPAPWDRYWQGQVTNRLAVALIHAFCNDGDLVDAMRANGLQTVLCVGSGISLEPRALAWAGFDVTALDLSPFAIEVASQVACSDESLASLIRREPGDRTGDVQFVVGDLCDPACCPGPYDVVIERRTLQLFLDAVRPDAVQAVADRLASPGIFVSQCHIGRCGTRDVPPPRAGAVVPRSRLAHSQRLAHLAGRRPAGGAGGLAAFVDRIDESVGRCFLLPTSRLAKRGTWVHTACSVRPAQQPDRS